MNDQGELRHGIELWVPKIKDFIKKVTEQNNPQKQMLDNLEKFFDYERAQPTIRPYVASFTADGDSPYHWLSYGDHGRGGRIALNFKKQICGLSVLLPVLYDEHAKSQLIDNIIKSLAEVVRCYSATVQAKNQCNDFLKAIILALTQIMLVNSARMKRSGWAHEREWRLITFVDSKKKRDQIHGEIKYRSRKSTMVDYLEIKISGVGGCLTELRKGPNSLSSSKNTWRMIWSDFGYPSDSLKESDVSICAGE
jgi:hypothetical protein